MKFTRKRSIMVCLLLVVMLVSAFCLVACANDEKPNDTVDVTLTAIALKEGTSFPSTMVKGTDFDLTGKKITATYSDKTTKDVDIVASMISGYDKTAVGEQTVTITYTDKQASKTTTFKTTVIEKVVVSIEVTTQPDKVVYNEGEIFDPAGMVIKATYNDNTIDEDFKEYTFADTALVYGTNKVEIACGEQKVEVSITVNAQSVYGIEGEDTYTVNANEVKNVDLTLKAVEDKGLGVEGALIYVSVVEGEKANVSLMATDTQGQEWNVAQIGFWGPQEGFAMSKDYNATTPFKATFAQAGTYKIKITVANVADNNIVYAEKEITITVE